MNVKLILSESGPQKTIKTGEILPLIPPPERGVNGKIEIPSHIHEALLAKRKSYVELAKKEGHWIQVPGYEPPKNRIIDYDFVLLVLCDSWLNIKSKSGEAPHFNDVRENLPPLLRKNIARKCLMSLRGSEWTPRDGWPDDDDNKNARWTVARIRRLHKSGYAFMPGSFSESDGERSYRATITVPGLARAIWIAMSVLTPMVSKKAAPSLCKIIKFP